MLKPSALEQLPRKQALFVQEFLTDFNGTQAAIRAGYSPKTANEQASRMLAKVSIQEALRELTSDRFQRLQIDADELLKRLHAVVFADANELSQFRRHCCRHCWGNGFAYQYTPGEYQKEKLKHETRRAELLAKSDGKGDIGEFPGIFGAWYDKRRDPNPECPECFGEGQGETFLQDTRKLSPAALALYAGVKEGRDGIEILTASKDRAAESLARALGLFKDKDVEVTVNVGSGEDLARLYEAKMAKSRERQAQVMAERGLAPGGEKG